MVEEGRTIGLIGDKEVETQVILLEHSIPFQPFTKEVMDCLPPENWKITPENSKGRVVFVLFITEDTPRIFVIVVYAVLILQVFFPVHVA